ncbi:MAG: B12-binding domain-containing radical SAM protein, partial [Candidatus Omnitrophica bacterium]|nr:B12-binding domain-containing radical SAM protein [Candidatus Omnitrophota bacterium]
PFNMSDHIQPSIGLGYLASAIRKEHEVRLVDCIKDDLTIDKFMALLKEYNPEILGLQCYTFDLPFIRQALKAAKAFNKNIVTVIGGPHSSALPEATLKAEKDLDFLFVGEAEKGFPLLVNKIEKLCRGGLPVLHSLSAGGNLPYNGLRSFNEGGNLPYDELMKSDVNKTGVTDFSGIPGLGYRDGSAIKINPNVIQDDLDGLGLAAWDLIKPQEYPESQHGAFFKQFPIAPIMVTRGCPYPCTFCAGSLVSGKKIRRRSIDNVLGELKMLNNDFGIREFHIIDDNFTMDKEYVKDFLRKLKALNLGMTWAVPNGVRMDTLDDELLGLMKETGLYMISLGIESGSDEVLSEMRKGITVARIRECVNKIDRAGIDIAGFFILGFPGETPESIRQTIDFAAELPLKRANFFTYLPFPGTESYAKLLASGELKDVDWERFYFTNAAYVPTGITRKELKSLHRLAFAKFYLRPHIIMYQLKSIQSAKHFGFLARRFMRWIVAN